MSTASSYKYMSCGGLLGVDGRRVSGQPVRTQNVTAVLSIANMVRSSLGPAGLDKMIVDELGDVIVTNDGATVLSNLDVEHPAAKVLVDLARLQDDECGDGTTGVVLIAAELLKNADELVRQRIHPTSIIAGYRMACQEACHYISSNLALAGPSHPNASAGDASDESSFRETLLSTARTSISSKLIGGDDADHFANLVVDAALAVKGKGHYCPIRAINILKAHGAGARDSHLMHGIAIANTIAASSMPHRVSPARIACLDFTLQKSKARVGVEVRIAEVDELTQVRMREFDMSKEKVQKIIAGGVNVVLTTGGVDDLCLKYFSEAGVIVVRRVKPIDMKRVARATGATFLTSLSDMEGEDVFTESMYGKAEEVYQEVIADDEMIVIQGPSSRGAASIIVRGPNDSYCEEMERALHDALCAVKRTIEGGAVVAGGGAVETALSIWLEDYANTISTREQLAITEFASALLTIPRSLAINGALDATDLIAKLRANHHLSQKDDNMVHLRWSGLDLDTGEVRDNMKAGVLEPASSKIKALRYATEAAITILRIDDMVYVNPPPPGPDQGKSYEEARASGQLQDQ